MMNWPPEYKIKKHRRASRVKLRVSRTNGLEITVPYRFNLNQIGPLLEDSKAWITKQFLHLQSQHKSALPNKISLNALTETWTIHYLQTHAKLQIIHRPQQEIVLVGNVADENACKKMLIHWLKEIAKDHLSAKLKMLSEKTTLTYTQVSVRNQQTLWGSCTANKAINLNYKLIFLPHHLVTHIMIHELCHTRYLNHSDAFWNLVAKHDENWQAHRREMRQAEQFIPDGF
jgi:predicted metal-dependent hydrolase